MGGGESKKAAIARADQNAARADQTSVRATSAEGQLEDMRLEKWREEEKARQRSWRTLPPEYEVWNEKALQILKERLKSKIKDSKAGDTLIRILLIGDTGSGKSSLINSMNSALYGSYTEAVIATARDQTTKKYVEIPMAMNEDESLPFVVCDFRGFGSKDAGASSESVEAALRGCIEDDQFIDPNARLKDYGRISSHEGDADMLTYIGVVINATLVDSLGTKHEPYQGTTEQINKAINFGIDHDMPTMVFLTMCDMLDQEVDKDVGRIYYSRKVLKAVQTAQSKLGIEQHQIIPVKNITTEVFMDAKTSFQFLFPISYLVTEVEGKMRIRRLKKMRKQRRK